MDDNIVDYRLDKLEKDVEGLKEQSSTLQLVFGRFESKQDNMLESINNLKEAVKFLTDKPVKEYNAIKVSVITGIITFLCTTGVALLITKLVS
jgi:anion-transporting  ArsA/GET3 family ATPase